MALLITAVLAIAKLMNLIDWSWWVVFAPILLTALIFTITAALILFFAMGALIYIRVKYGRP